MNLLILKYIFLITILIGGNFVLSQTDLPTSWDISGVIPKGWGSNTSQTYNLGNISAPSLRLGNSGDYLIINSQDQMGEVSFYLKAFANDSLQGTFRVLASSDSSVFIPLLELVNNEISISQFNKYTLTPPDSIRYIVFEFTNKINGNLGIDDISINEAFSSKKQEIRIEDLNNNLIRKNSDISFGEIINDTLNLFYVINNIGDSLPLIIDSVKLINNEAFEILSSIDTIKANELDTLKFRFFPIINQTYIDTLIIYNNDFNEGIFKLNLKGYANNLAQKPLKIAKNGVFSNVSTYGFNYSYENPSDSLPNGFLAVRKKLNTITTAIPQNGVIYEVGDVIGDAQVILVGDSTNWKSNHVYANEYHEIRVYSYNGEGNYIHYNTDTFLTSSITTPNSMQPANYYIGIDVNDTLFLEQLTAKINPHTKISYGDYDEIYIEHFAAYDSSGSTKAIQGSYSGQVYVYTPPFDYSVFSREHTYSYSWMPDDNTNAPHYSDIHNLYPVNQNNANVIRNNYRLGEVKTPTYQYLDAKFGYDNRGELVFEPRNEHKGDAARAIFYMVATYQNIDSNDWKLRDSISDKINYYQDEEILKSWHWQDPVSDFERARNDFIYSVQGNRNPFIDSAQYVCYINFREGKYIPSAGNCEENKCYEITTTSISICTGDSIYFGEEFIKNQNTYVDTITRNFGCDSIIQLTLYVDSFLIDSISQQICSGDSVYFGGKYLLGQGIYYDTVLSVNNCDTINILNLLVKSCTCDNLYFSEYIEGSSNNKALEIFNPTADTINLFTYALHRFTNGATSSSSFNLSGNLMPFSTYVIANSGADSTILSKANITSGLMTFNGDDALLLMQGTDTLDIFGYIGEDPGSEWTNGGVSSLNTTLIRKKEVAGGVKYNEPFNPDLEWDAYSEDYSGDLGFHKSICFNCNYFRDTITELICMGDSVFFSGVYYRNEGFYQDTLLYDYTCDTVSTFQVVFYNQDTTLLQDSICNGSSYLFNDLPLTTSGIYYDTLVGQYGCDSILQLDLSILPIDTTLLQDSICNGSSYLFNGLSLATSGIYYDTLVGQYGCDSILQLDLSILSIDTTLLQDSICNGDFYSFNGLSLTTSGIYYDTLMGQYGCDSILQLNLSVFPIDTTFLKDSICSGRSYSFNGLSLTTSGIYYDTLMGQYGCDSILKLELEVKIISSESINITTNSITNVCLGDTISFEAITLAAGSHFSYEWEINGFQIGGDSLKLELVPTINQNGDSVICKIINNEFCGDTILSNAIKIEVNPLPVVNIILNGIFLETDSNFINYQWYLNDTVLFVDTTYKIAPNTNGVYKVYITDSNGCNAYGFYNLNSVGIENIKDEDIIIYPNPANNKVTIDFNQKVFSEIKLYNSSGKLVYSSKQSEAIININLPSLSNGVYYLLVNKKDTIFSKKILINK